MKPKYSNLFLFFGVACFLASTIALLVGQLEAPLNMILPALGLILIGAGAAGKRSLTKGD